MRKDEKRTSFDLLRISRPAEKVPLVAPQTSAAGIAILRSTLLPRRTPAMKTLIALSAALLLLGLATSAHAQLGKTKPVRLLAEAEDFTVEKGPWSVTPFRENYYASTFAISFLSRMACLSAPAQIAAGAEAVASQKVNIPHAGAFHVLARYEQPFNFSAEF